MTAAPLPHFILTRAGITTADEHWYRNARVIMEATCIASLEAQHCTGFHWLVAVDEAAPAWFTDWLEERFRGQPRFHVVRVGVQGAVRCRLASFDWVFDLALRTTGLHQIVDEVDDFIITSNLDYDDAWAGFVTTTVQQHFAALAEQLKRAEATRSYLLAPSAGALLTLTNGARLDVREGVWRPEKTECASMSVFVLSRLSSGISASSCRHRAWPGFSRIVEFEYAAQPTDTPAWLYIRHPDAMSEASLGGRVQNPISDEFLAAFGISAERLAGLGNIAVQQDNGGEQAASERWQRLYRASSRAFFRK